MGKSTEMTPHPALTPIAVEFQNDALVAEAFCNVVPVDLESDVYYEHAASEAFDVYDDNVEQDSVVPEVTSRVTERTYTVEDHGLREPVGKKRRMQAQAAGYDALARATNKVTNHVKLNHEIRAASVLTNTSNYLAANVMTAGAGSSPGKWTNQTTGDPIRDLETMIDLLLGVGMGRIKILFGLTAWRNLSLHTKVLSAFQPTSATAVIQPEQIKQALGVDEVFIGRARKSTANKANQDEGFSNSRVWGDNVVIAVQPPEGAAGKEVPAFAYTFRQRVNGNLLNVYSYFQHERGGHGSDWIQVAMDDVTKVVAKSYGAIITATS